MRSLPCTVPFHETIYRGSFLENGLIDTVSIGDGAAIAHFWSRLTTGEAHPAARRSRHADRHMHLPELVMLALGRAHPDYIGALLSAIDERCGSIEGYVEELGLTPAGPRAMREELLN